jgi:hypothetical protein
VNKYRAKRTVVDGLTFDSRKEARRYGELKLLLQGRKITDLQLHPRFELRVNGHLIGHYTADFEYFADGKQVVEDVKSRATRTRDYVLRRKLMKALHGIEVMEV